MECRYCNGSGFNEHDNLCEFCWGYGWQDERCNVCGALEHDCDCDDDDPEDYF